MILIGGTNLATAELPFAKEMDYVVENDRATMDIKLKTTARGTNCVVIYLHESFKELNLSDDVAVKTKYFASDAALEKELKTGGNPELEEKVVVPEEQPQQTFFQATTPTPPPPTTSVERQSIVSPLPGFQLILEEADTNIPEQLISHPETFSDLDNFDLDLQKKDAIIHDQKLQLVESDKRINDLLRTSEIQMLHMKESNRKLLAEANTRITALTKQVEDMRIDPELQNFLRYAPYSINYKAMLHEEFSQEDLKRMGKLASPVHIIATGSGDSYLTLAQKIESLVASKAKALIVDFSNEPFLNLKFGLNTKDTSMLLAKEEIKVSQLVKQVNGVDFIATESYNDLALLNMDWAMVIRKLTAYANGKPVIMLFNNIGAFSVRHTASKLSTIGTLHVMVKCNPAILTTLFRDISFIPRDRVTVVVLDYIDIVQDLLKKMGEKNSIVGLPKGDINWSKLNIIK